MACNNSRKKSENIFRNGQNLEKTDEIQLKTDDLGTIDFLRHQVFEIEDSTFIYVLNKSISALEIYNLTSAKFVKRIGIPDEGPHAITNLQGFFVHSSDSIFVFPQGHVKNTILVSSKGEVLSHFSPPVPKNDIHGIVNHKSVPSAPSYFKDKKLYFSVLPLLDTKVPENINESVLLASEFILEDNQLDFPDKMHYPSSYLKKGWVTYHTNYSRIIDEKGNWIYSFAGSDSLFIYDNNYKLNSKVLAKSKEIEEIPSFEVYPGKLNSMQMCIEYGSYGRVLYDKFKNLYYRIVRLPRGYDPKGDYDINALAKSAFSIIKFDGEFNRLSETVFEKEIYDLNCVFITKKGLNIPRTNYWNEDLAEDMVTIDVFN
ncbi:DUF4221 family protein [Echinicola salinicaeni]|uniref:DUF4221 family protein n=1 Tax=Echinicola salinicaeni TaxID=2762757 RepID=UPI001647FE54|nr:DUF4221 family protein [Echinicola salinicaeni]